MMTDPLRREAEALFRQVVFETQSPTIELDAGDQRDIDLILEKLKAQRAAEVRAIKAKWQEPGANLFDFADWLDARAKELEP